ncbi:hypothetical protein [Streptomyces bambusae]|uniref:hypothetical protein n=1 Tax=Streptomyces bambusae TaxID=1550616 RepID=UPI001CA50F69|nr:hypothetical protein [Streptomyces bambusae]
MIEGDVVEFGFLRQEVAGFAEEGAGGVEDGAGDPVVEVVRSLRGVALGEFAAVSGGASHDGIGHQGGARVGDLPELGGEPEVQGGDDEFEPGATAQRGVAGQQLSHEGQGGAAQQQAYRGVGVLGGRVEGALDDRREGGGGLGEEGELVDHCDGGAAVGDAQEFGDGLVPVREAERRGLAAVAGQCLLG